MSKVDFSKEELENMVEVYGEMPYEETGNSIFEKAKKALKQEVDNENKHKRVA